MAYDSKKDKEIKSWRIPIADEQTAIVALKTYDGHNPKLQIGPMEINSNGNVIHSRVKRWGWSELLKLREVLDEAIELMDK